MSNKSGDRGVLFTKSNSSVTDSTEAIRPGECVSVIVTFSKLLFCNLPVPASNVHKKEAIDGFIDVALDNRQFILWPMTLFRHSAYSLNCILYTLTVNSY